MGRIVHLPALILLFSIFHAEHGVQALKIDPHVFEQVQPTRSNDNAAHPSVQLVNPNIPLHPFHVDNSASTRPHKLHGRFLHISDLHPDEFYVFDSAVSQSCHRKKPKKEKERAGTWGVPFRCVSARQTWSNQAHWLDLGLANNISIVDYSDCDSPLALTNLTFEYLSQEWADNIDFVICTPSFTFCTVSKVF